MMEVKPFKAFRFDADVVGDVAKCVSPPYDVISPAQRQQLYEKSECNIVRIIKGKTTPSDDDNNNQYTRAADYLNTWIDKGVLKQDPAEAIYAYTQDFELAGSRFRRQSFIALARLEEFGKMVRPHEQTLDEPKIDRLHLKRATVAKFGLVFMLYEDQQRTSDKIIENAANEQPLIEFLDGQNVKHQLCAITAPTDIRTITETILHKECIIADGHHRYETALNYYKETNNPAAAYQMTAFVNTCQSGLIILATHRLVGNLEGFHFGELLAGLRDNFDVTEYSFDSDQDKDDAKKKMFARMKAESDQDGNAFGIYGAGNAFHAVVLRDSSAMDGVAPDRSKAFRSLDVSVLHNLILERHLGIDEQRLASGSNIEYVKDSGSAVDESIAKVDAGQKQAAFFMNPAKMKQIEMVTAAGEIMPQKSTYFYPKMYTGLTINKL